MSADAFRPDFSLSGKLALVTGSRQGLGYAIAQAYAASGAQVILNGRDASALQAAADALRERTGTTVHTWPVDLTDLSGLARRFQDLCATVGVPDILVNNVGIRIRKSLADATLTEILTLVQANLLSAMQLSRLAACAMRDSCGPASAPGGVHAADRRAGRILTLTSIAGALARPGDGIYPVAKQGLVGLVRALAVEFGPLGITSNGIAPGTFATETNAALAADPVEGVRVIGRNPLSRWARPDEITGAAVFLASPSASYVNGHVLVVDGGFSVAF